MSDDLVQQLRELASRTHDINDHTSLHLSADEIERLCALLAFQPPAEDVRREALEFYADPKTTDPIAWREAKEKARAALASKETER